VKLTKTERRTALEGFFAAQGKEGISITNANNILAPKWQISPKMLTKDFKEMAAMGILTLKNGKLYHSEALNDFIIRNEVI